MHEPFQVIEGGNPDDSFALSKPTHLTEVHPAPTPATATVTTLPRPWTLRIVDAVIGLLMRLRERIERPVQPSEARSAERPEPWSGRGW